MYTRQPRSSDDVVAYSIPVLSFISPDVFLAEVLTGSIQTHFRCIILLGHSNVVVENSRVSLKGLGLCCTRGDWALMATPLHSRASCVFVVPTVSGGKLREGGRIVTTVCVPRRSTTSLKLCCSFDESNVSSPPSTVDLAPPTIDLEIVGPEAGGEATRTSVGSGEKLLRNIILENKLELYGLYGKVMNCGGGGSCGTCVVEILEGQELLNERTDTEYKYLKKKPESWRLSCQTIVGDKSNSGKVVVQRLPQKKK